MSTERDVQIDQQLKDLYENFAAGRVSRRDFMLRATAMGVAGAAAATLGPLATSTVRIDQGSPSRRGANMKFSLVAGERVNARRAPSGDHEGLASRSMLGSR